MSHFSGNFFILTTILNLVNCDFWTLHSQTQVTELVEFSICLWLFECNPLKNYESLGFMVIQIWIFMILRIIRRLVLVFISLNLQLQIYVCPYLKIYSKYLQIEKSEISWYEPYEVWRNIVSSSNCHTSIIIGFKGIIAHGSIYLWFVSYY